MAAIFSNSDLKTAILTEPLANLVARLVLERIPAIFSGDWTKYRRWRACVGNCLTVDACNVCLTGSSCVGHSLSPTKNLSQFDEKSDIDIAVISNHHFDLAWHALRSFRIADISDPKEKQSLREHQQRYVYWGCIAIDKILRLLPFAREWTIAATKIQNEDPTLGRSINFRIYKDYNALRSYQLRGLHSLRDQLLSEP